MGNISCFFQSHNETKQELRMVKFWVTELSILVDINISLNFEKHNSVQDYFQAN